MSHPLLDVNRIDGPLVEYLASCGDVFAAIRFQPPYAIRQSFGGSGPAAELEAPMPTRRQS